MRIPRRTFLQGGLGLLSLALPASELIALAAQSVAAAPRVPGGKILVVVQLAGGVDGLNMVIPYADDAYLKARPQIGIKPKDALQLTDKIALHPSMSELQKMYKAGSLAIVQGVGYPEPNRSHFRSIEIWQTAEPRKVKESGWLGRYLDLTCSEKTRMENIFPAINVDPILPKTLSAERVIVPSVNNISTFTFKGNSDRDAQLEVFNDIYRDFKLPRPYIHQLRDIGLNTTKASDYMNDLVKKYKSTVDYPNNGFGKSMKFIAQLITGGVNCQLYNVTLGGFDTHTNEQRQHDTLFRQLSQGINALYSDLAAAGLDKDVVLMTFSEFGRRVAENGGRGTDHGTALPMLIAGPSVQGGLVGDHPSLTDLDSGDLKYKIDFRCVYATLLDKWLGASSKQVLGDKYDTLDLIKTG